MRTHSGLFTNPRILCGDFSYKVIMKDLNVDLPSTSDDAKIIGDLAKEFSIQIVQHCPTHPSPSSHTCIDLILVNDSDVIRYLRCELLPFNCRNNIVDVSVKIIAQTYVEGIFYCRDYRSISVTELNECLASSV